MTTIPPLISHLLSSIDDVIPTAGDELAEALFKLRPLLNLLQQAPLQINPRPLAKALASLNTSLTSRSDLATAVGLLLLAWPAASMEVKVALDSIKKELVVTGETEIEEEEEEGVDLGELVIRVKKGGEEEVGPALGKLAGLVRMGIVGEEESGGVVSALLCRLGSARSGHRLMIISILRCLASMNEDNKVLLL